MNWLIRESCFCAAWVQPVGQDSMPGVSCRIISISFCGTKMLWILFVSLREEWRRRPLPWNLGGGCGNAVSTIMPCEKKNPCLKLPFTFGETRSEQEWLMIIQIMRGPDPRSGLIGRNCMGRKRAGINPAPTLPGSETNIVGAGFIPARKGESHKRGKLK